MAVIRTHLSRGLARTHAAGTLYAVDTKAGGRSSAIIRNMCANSSRGIATAAIWKATQRARLTTFATAFMGLTFLAPGAHADHPMAGLSDLIVEATSTPSHPGLRFAQAPDSASSPAPAPSPSGSPSTMQIIRPTRATGVLANPGIGYQTFYTSASSDRQLPSTTMYTRFNWSQIEPYPGVYNFFEIDKALSSAKAARQRLAFRIMGFEGGNYGPQGLRRAQYPGFSFKYDGASGYWFPDMNQVVVQDDVSRLVAALGRRYGNDPALDSIDIGFVGAWGEFHFWNASPKVPFPSTSSINNLSKTFLAHFKPPLLIGGDLAGQDLNAFKYAMENKIGWRVDCWGNYDSGWNHMRDAYPLILSSAPDAWRNAPVALEPCGVMSDWITAKYPWRDALQWAIDNHASQFSNKSAPIPADMMPYVRDMLTKIGYRFYLSEIQLPQSIRADSSFPLILSWSNIGNAPMYFDRTVLVRIGDQVVDTGISMKGFLPGSRIDKLSISAKGLAAGTHSVQIGLAPPGSRSPDISLAIVGTGPWYPLADIVVEK